MKLHFSNSLHSKVDQTDCVTSTAGALQWVIEYLDEFNPFEDDGSFKVKKSKSILELAIMLYCRVQLTGDRSSDEVRRILAFLEAVHENRGLRDRLLRFPMEFPLLSGLYGVLRQLGKDDLEQRHLIQRAMDAGFLDYTERVPHRVMDVRLTLEWGDLPHNYPGLDTLYAATILAQVPCPLYLNESAAYALTHVIFFTFSFGAETDVPAPYIDIKGLRQTLTMLIVIYCHEHHWDLLAEVLLCWDCVGLEPSMIYERGWAAFLATQMADGAFPGPERPRWSDEEGQPDTGRKRADHFWTNYHTTLVGIIAGTLRVARLRGDVRSADTNLPDARDPKMLPGFEHRIGQDRLHLDCSLAISGAKRWLEQTLAAAERDEHSTSAAFCYILLGWWICESAWGNRAPESSDIPHRVWQALVTRDSQPEGPPSLRIIVEALLSSRGLSVPSLRDFTTEAAEALNTAPASDPIADLALCEKRVLLHALGLEIQPQLAGYTEVLDFARTFPLTSSRACLEDLLLRIESLTGYGTRRVTLSKGDLWSQELLVGLAMHFLRKYDFVTGCRLLRSMAYLGVDYGDSFEACLRFLLLHQRPEGAIGFFGLEEAVLKARALEGYSLDANLYLPVTVGCLAALAEGTNSEWRLYGSLPQIALLRR